MPRSGKLAVLGIVAIFIASSATRAHATSLSLGEADTNFTTPASGSASSVFYAAASTETYESAVINPTLNLFPAGDEGKLEPTSLTSRENLVVTALSAAVGADLGRAVDTVSQVVLGSSVVSPNVANHFSHCADGPCNGSPPIDFSGITANTGATDSQYTYATVSGTMDMAFATSSDPNVPNLTAVAPEPSGLLLLGTGLMAGAGLVYLRRRSIEPPVAIKAAGEPADDIAAV